MKVVLKSRITNTSGSKQFFRWVMPHGHYMEPGQTIVAPGAYPSVVANSQLASGCVYDIENKRAAVVLITNLPVESPDKPQAKRSTSRPAILPPVVPPPEPEKKVEVAPVKTEAAPVKTEADAKKKLESENSFFVLGEATPEPGSSDTEVFTFGETPPAPPDMGDTGFALLTESEAAAVDAPVAPAEAAPVAPEAPVAAPKAKRASRSKSSTSKSSTSKRKSTKSKSEE